MEAQEVKTVLPPLGLGTPPAPVRLFVEHIVATPDTPACGWLRYEEKLRVSVTERGLFGYLVDVRYTKGEYQGKPKLNLRFTVKADRLYIIQSGGKSAFCKGLVQRLIAVEDFSLPICLEVDPPDGNDKVVFANVHIGTLMGEDWTFEKVQAEDYDAEARLDPLVRKLQQKLGTPVQQEAELYELLGRTPPSSVPPSSVSSTPAARQPSSVAAATLQRAASVPPDTERIGAAGNRVMGSIADERRAAAAATPHGEITHKTLEDLTDEDIPWGPDEDE